MIIFRSTFSDFKKLHILSDYATTSTTFLIYAICIAYIIYVYQIKICIRTNKQYNSNLEQAFM